MSTYPPPERTRFSWFISWLVLHGSCKPLLPFYFSAGTTPLIAKKHKLQYFKIILLFWHTHLLSYISRYYCCMSTRLQIKLNGKNEYFWKPIEILIKWDRFNKCQERKGGLLTFIIQVSLLYQYMLHFLIETAVLSNEICDFL